MRVLRLLLVMAAAMFVNASVVGASGAGTPNFHDSQVIVGLSIHIKTLQRQVAAVSGRELQSAGVMLKSCPASTGIVALVVERSVAEINTGYRIRAQARKTKLYFLAQTFANPTLTQWLASLQKGEVLSQKSGLYNHLVRDKQACTIVRKLDPLLAEKTLPLGNLPDRVYELVGINMRLVRASSATKKTRQVLEPQVLPMFRAAGLSDNDAKTLANL